MAHPEIDKKTIDHLASLAHIRISEKQAASLEQDLRSIIGYVAQLSEVTLPNASGDMAGGRGQKNILREDGERINTLQGLGVAAFPETDKGLLVVPPVFERGE